MAIEKATDGLSDEMKEHDDLEARRGFATGLAINFARALNEEESKDHTYLLYRNSPDWRPHIWIVDAIMHAVQIGKDLGKQEAESKNLFVQNQLDEHYREAQTSIVRATVAAVMEAGINLNAELLERGETTCIMNLEKQRTIWDRWELDTQRNPEETEVTFTLTRK